MQVQDAEAAAARCEEQAVSAYMDFYQQARQLGVKAVRETEAAAWKRTAVLGVIFLVLAPVIFHAAVVLAVLSVLLGLYCLYSNGKADSGILKSMEELQKNLDAELNGKQNF